MQLVKNSVCMRRSKAQNQRLKQSGCNIIGKSYCYSNREQTPQTAPSVFIDKQTRQQYIQRNPNPFCGYIPKHIIPQGGMM